MIDIFAALHYSEERQVTFAVFQLEGAVRSWWNVIRMKWDWEQTPRTWVNLMRDFNAKYFSPLVQEKKEDEFIRLRQGAQTVAEYESQFTRLPKFAPELILTEQRRVRRFIQRLNVEIQKDLAVAQINTFSEVVEKALRVENARLQVRNFQVKKRGFFASSSTQGDKSTPPKFGRGAGGGRLSGMARGTPPRGGQNGRGQQRSASQGSSASVSRGPCGKPNDTEDNCWRKERKCLRCGSAEHQIANCPVLPREARVTTQSSKANSVQSKVEGTKPKVPARVYSLEQHQVPDSSGVVEGERKLLRNLISLAIKGYDVILANVVADALSQKAQISGLMVKEWEMLGVIGEWNPRLERKKITFGNIRVTSTLLGRIKEAQTEDSMVQKWVKKVEKGEITDFNLSSEGVLRFKNRIVVPGNENLKREILEEAHQSKYTIHPGSNKMYQHLRRLYWWDKMKREIA
ncbi:uncharacterized protein [Coffea arabica]|uniref:Retrotransposon gag domain-containing protein n=1 Tax=Coffea arabica TaxID=13443 RepID=A0ABM4VQJ6_COFAR